MGLNSWFQCHQSKVLLTKPCGRLVTSPRNLNGWSEALTAGLAVKTAKPFLTAKPLS